MRVAIVGGGYAGMAAAVTLAEAGVAVTVYEAGPHLGGRARRVEVNGVALDNGLHILIGAYRETLGLVHRLHPDSAKALARFPLDWQIHRHLRLKAAPLPAPLHLAAGLLTAQGLPWSERTGAVRFMYAMRAAEFRLPGDISVRELLAQHHQGPRISRYLWEPLCIAALNTPPEIASAQIFLNVLRDGLNADRAASEMLVSRVDLTALFPEPAAAHVRSRGGEVLTGLRIEAIEAKPRGVRLAKRDGEALFDHAICAVSPHQVSGLLAGNPELAGIRAQLDALRYQPIHSIYFQHSGAIRLPAPMLGFDGTAQWLFDREAICGQRGMIGAVISADGPHASLPRDALARAVHEEIAHELGPLPPLEWHQVIAEKRATFECGVGLERPAARTPLDRLHLAGDYTERDYPATIESAVRSGIAAARQVLASH